MYGKIPDNLIKYNLSKLTCQYCGWAQNMHDWLNIYENLCKCNCKDKRFASRKFRSVNEIDLAIGRYIKIDNMYYYIRVFLFNSGETRSVISGLYINQYESDSILFSDISDLTTTIIELETILTFQ